MQLSINYVFWLVGWFVVVFVFKEIVTGQHQRAKISFFVNALDGIGRTLVHLSHLGGS